MVNQLVIVDISLFVHGVRGRLHVHDVLLSDSLDPRNFLNLWPWWCGSESCMCYVLGNWAKRTLE